MSSIGYLGGRGQGGQYYRRGRGRGRGSQPNNYRGGRGRGGRYKESGLNLYRYAENNSSQELKLYFREDDPAKLATIIRKLYSIFEAKNNERLIETIDVLRFLDASNSYENSSLNEIFSLTLRPKTILALEDIKLGLADIESLIGKMKSVREFVNNLYSQKVLAELAEKAKQTRLREEEEKKQAQLKLEQERILEEKRKKEEEEQRRKHEDEDKKAAEEYRKYEEKRAKLMKEEQDRKEQKEKDYIESRKPYVIRCLKYIGDVDNDVDDKDVKYNYTTREEINDIIIDAHQKYNDELLEHVRFPGCSEMGIDCDSDCVMCQEGECYWKVGMWRCACGNSKDLCFNTEDVDWLKDINLDSTNFVGYQEKIW